MKQMTFASLDYANKKRVTRRERFLCEMDAVIPWMALITVIEPHYPKTNPRGGHPTLPLETMLRVYFMQ